jgi:hypothetical protein|tara:strand:+ start:618 stop:1325 length:708 start_codon:yes stop_codon:yes gene_type:complete
MFNFECEIYDNENLTIINFADYIKNKKVLICPSVKILQKPSLKYFQYVETLLNLQGLDEIIIIDSKSDKFFHPAVYSFFPKIKTVSDTSQNYIKIMQKEKNKSQNINELAKIWVFQHLIDNNKEIGFWEQPLENHWEQLLKNKRAMKELLDNKTGWNAKIIATLLRSKIDFWNVDNYNIMAPAGHNAGQRNPNEDGKPGDFRPAGYQLLHRLGHKLWYFNLYNNKELENTIIGNN